MDARTLTGTRLLPAAALVAALVLALGAAPATGQPDAATAPGRVAAADALESPVLARINRLRRAHGLAPLRLSSALTRAAEGHARSMGRRGFFSHSSADGTAVATRIRSYYGGATVGETLLWRSPDVTAAKALGMWLASPPHRHVLLYATFREIGLAAVHVPRAPGAYRGLDVTILVADFGAR